MRSNAAILENDVGNIDSVEQEALELIRRFNDPDREHALRGVFKTGEAGQDRGQGRPPWSIRHVPTGRGCGAEGTISENPEPDR